MSKITYTSLAVLFLLLSIITTTTLINALANGRAPVPARGASTWCTGPAGTPGRCGEDVCNEVEIKRIANTLKSSGLYDLGYSFIWMDDCWEADYRLPNGSITWDTSRFPSGMPSLISWVKSQGMELGLYISLGNWTCDRGGRPSPIPGSEGKYQDDVNTLASWNCTAIKADWCGFHHEPNGQPDPYGPDGIEVGAKFYKAISDAVMHNSAGLNIYLQGVAAIFFLWGDTPEYVNSWRATVDHHDNWANTIENIAFVMEIREPLGRPGAWAFMDILTTGGQGCTKKNSTGGYSAHCPGQTNTEYITEFTIWNVLQSPLSVGTDLSDMTPIMETILFNKQMLDMHEDTRTPPGKYIGGDKSCDIILGKFLCSFFLRQLADGSVFLVLLNANNETKNIVFNFADNLKYLPQNTGMWGPNTTCQVTDLWSDAIEKTNKKYSAPSSSSVSLMKDLSQHHEQNLIKNPAKIVSNFVSGSFSAEVDAHGVAAVVLKPES